MATMHGKLYGALSSAGGVTPDQAREAAEEAASATDAVRDRLWQVRMATAVNTAVVGLLVVAVGTMVWQFAGLRGDAGVTAGQVAGLHSEIAGLRDQVAATNTKIDALRAEITAQLAALTRELGTIEQRPPRQ